MSDLIERLRNIRGSFVIPIEAPDVFGWADEAADEIERLKDELDAERYDSMFKDKEIERLRRNLKLANEICGEWAKDNEEYEKENAKLQAVVDAAKEVADDYERYEPRGDNWLDYPLHDVEILGAFKRRLAALEGGDGKSKTEET